MAYQVSKYNEDMQALADSYVDGAHVYADDLVPSIAGMSVFLRVCRDTLYEWAKHHPDFTQTMAACKVKQEKMLLSGGLSQKYSAAITKLMLAKHDYSDKSKSEISGPGGNPLTLLLQQIDGQTAKLVRDDDEGDA